MNMYLSEAPTNAVLCYRYKASTTKKMSGKTSEKEVAKSKLKAIYFWDVRNQMRRYSVQSASSLILNMVGSNICSLAADGSHDN